MVVLMGFVGAFYLINSSYSAWQESPVATSITTHPLADLDFPTVTVCPPKGSNTALNYDLMKANDTSLSNENKETLKNKIFNIFIRQPHQEYIKTMLAVANKGNMRQIFAGFQSVPRPNAGTNGFKIRMWNNNGSWHTPWFGAKYDSNYYKKDIHYNLEIEIPQELSSEITSRSLVVQLEMETRDEEGWQEEVVYWEGPKYKLYKEEKNWTDAEATCQEGGGHLASLLSEGDQREVSEFLGWEPNVWIGAIISQEEGVWGWSDRSPWGYENWHTGSGTKGDDNNCVYFGRFYDFKWDDHYCTFPQPFICQFPPAEVLKGFHNLTLEYMKENLTFATMNFFYRYRANQQLLESRTDNRMTGFQLSWFLLDNNGSRLTGIQNIKEDMRPRYQESLLVSMVQLATQARIQNLGFEEIIRRTILEKAKLIKNGKVVYYKMCSGDQIKPNNYFYIGMGDLNIGLNSTSDAVANDEDILNGFMMFSSMIYCSESGPLYQFLHSLLSTQSPRTIIQATVNTIQSGDIQDVSNMKRIGEFYIALDKIFHFQLGKILLATVSSSDLKTMMSNDWPYFSLYAQEIDQCLNNASCQGVIDLIHTLGKYYSSKPKHVCSLVLSRFCRYSQ